MTSSPKTSFNLTDWLLLRIRTMRLIPANPVSGMAYIAHCWEALADKSSTPVVARRRKISAGPRSRQLSNLPFTAT